MAGTDGGHGASLGSWFACLVIIAGFVLGGVAMVVWNWPLFWISVAIVVVGCVLGAAFHIMDDVSEYGGHAGGGDPEPST